MKIPTPAGQAYLEDIAKRNARLTSLWAQRSTHLQPHQGLSMIYDLDCLLHSSELGHSVDTDDLLDLERKTLSEFVGYLAYGPDPLRLHKTLLYDLRKPPENYFEATHRSDAEVRRLAMTREIDSLKSMGVFTPSDLPPG
ncbi:hypothetical protein C0993_010848 [Termitomyces sp. T159_Od127]|nr:hypothetical protein C0993_010848 [Termitomyces sp. T159_Od127]